VFGISSHVRHSVGGDAYGTARVSAFMGLKIILTEMRKRGMPVGEKDHYLCNISPRDYRDRFRAALPDTIKGREFLKAYGEITDTVTLVDPDKTYNVRLGAEHPIFENYRVQTFVDCIQRAGAGDRTALVEAGGLMYASHVSHGWNCGLGCAETDLLVSLVRERGPENGLYGAKITGGGSGGTVAVLADCSAEDSIREIAAEYENRTGITPDIFDSTSPGAYAYGVRQYHFT
jgi:L-arabinokinase